MSSGTSHKISLWTSSNITSCPFWITALTTHHKKKYHRRWSLFLSKIPNLQMSSVTRYWFGHHLFSPPVTFISLYLLEIMNRKAKAINHFPFHKHCKFKAICDHSRYCNIKWFRYISEAWQRNLISDYFAINKTQINFFLQFLGYQIPSFTSCKFSKLLSFHG